MSNSVAQLFEIEESPTGMAAVATWMQQQMSSGYPNLIISEAFEDLGTRHLLLVMSGSLYRTQIGITLPVQTGQFEIRNNQKALLAFLDQVQQTGQLYVLFTDIFDKDGGKFLSIAMGTPD